jgi:hypothetical protein
MCSRGRVSHCCLVTTACGVQVALASVLSRDWGGLPEAEEVVRSNAEVHQVSGADSRGCCCGGGMPKRGWVVTGSSREPPRAQDAHVGGALQGALSPGE